MYTRQWVVVRAAAFLLVDAFAPRAIGLPLPAETRPAGAFTATQALLGQHVYSEKCSMCHGVALEGRDAPALAGMAFMQKFGSAERLHGYLSTTMPPFAPGRLSEHDYLDITAYILSVNGVRAGDRELTRTGLRTLDPGQLASPALAGTDRVDEGTAPDVDVPQAFTWGRELRRHESLQGKTAEEPEKVTIGIPDRIDASADLAGAGRPARHYVPVTDAMVLDPPPGEWLASRRTLDVHGYSPLDQIDRSNVADLELAWAWPMAEGGQQQTAPLVHDGIMFIATTDSVVQALDAASGDLIWEFRPVLAELPSSWGYQRYQARRQKGSIALYRDKVILATADARLIVLDALSGRVVRETRVLDHARGYVYTVGPLAVNQKIISGVGGCSISATAGGCYIVAHDFETGRELWRFNIIDDPENPEQQRSWGAVPPANRWGGTPWTTGSYDPRTNTTFWGTGQPGPYPELLRGSGNGSLLYTNTTLALDADTGKRRWHYQHLPRDNWDMDSPFERMLIDQTIDGKPRRLLVTVAGKNGIAFALDRDTGEFLWARETIVQNVVTAIDANGKVKINESLIATALGEQKFVCPSLWGGKSWQAAAYSPLTRMLYVPVAESCNTLVPVRVEFTDGNVVGSVTAGPRVLPPGIGDAGVIDAMDVATGKRRWRHSQRSILSSSLLTTGGGLVFGGDAGRYFMALDQSTGEVLWRVRLNAPIGGYPMSYRIDDVQYLAVPTGYSAQAGSAAALFPEIPVPSGSGNSLFVFRLRGSVH